MTDLRLDPVTHDLAFSDGDLEVTGRRGNEASEQEEIVQRLKVLLLTTLAEWSFDTDAGVNYFGIVFADDADDDAIRSHLVAVVSGGFRINRVIEMTLTRLPDRRLSVVGKVNTDLGTLPFDVETP